MTIRISRNPRDERPNTVSGLVAKHKKLCALREGYQRVKQFVLSTLREASAPMSTIELAKLWAEARGLRTDETVMTALGKQVSMCIRNCATQGLVEADGMATDTGALGPCKLCKLKRDA
jgi:hypothetical protein